MIRTRWFTNSSVTKRQPDRFTWWQFSVVLSFSQNESFKVTPWWGVAVGYRGIAGRESRRSCTTDQDSSNSGPAEGIFIISLWYHYGARIRMHQPNFTWSTSLSWSMESLLLVREIWWTLAPTWGVIIIPCLSLQNTSEGFTLGRRELTRLS